MLLATASKRLKQLIDQRNRRFDHYLHLVSPRLIDVLCLNHIGTLVIGKNLGWKQEINLGKRTNQNFVQLPHARLYKQVDSCPA
jgi:putative transposase